MIYPIMIRSRQWIKVQNFPIKNKYILSWQNAFEYPLAASSNVTYMLIFPIEGLTLFEMKTRGKHSVI